MNNARDRLLAVHRQRQVDRTVIGSWVGSLKGRERGLFMEYVTAFRELSTISIPTFRDAIASDPVLGKTWPESLSNESLKKWLARCNVEEPSG